MKQIVIDLDKDIITDLTKDELTLIKKIVENSLGKKVADKNKLDYKKLMDYFNFVFKKQTRVVTDKAKKNLDQRLKEGYEKALLELFLIMLQMIVITSKVITSILLWNFCQDQTYSRGTPHKYIRSHILLKRNRTYKLLENKINYEKGFKILNRNDCYNDLMKYRENGAIRGVYLGFPILHELYTISVPE